MRAWLIVICTLLTFAQLSTCNTRIKAFTVFFLTLWLLTVAPFKLFQIIWDKLIFLFYHLFCFLYQTFALFVIMTSITCTFRRTQFTRRKTLAVHLKAFSFFTNTTSSFFLWSCSSLSMLSLTFKLYIKRKIKWIFIIINFRLWISDIFLEKRERANWKVLFCLYKLKCFPDHINWREVKDSILGKKEMTHVLWISSN